MTPTKRTHKANKRLLNTLAAIAASALTPSITVDASELTASHPAGDLTPNVFAEQFIDDKGYLKLSYYNFLLEETAGESAYKLIFSIDSLTDMRRAIEQINEQLPLRVEFKSLKYNHKALKRLYNDALAFYTGSKLHNFNTLANYRENLLFSKFILVDRSHAKYTARQIEGALNDFTNTLAENIRHDSQEQSTLNLYDYIYEHFQYNATSYQNMIVGNLGNGELACNGFSRLAHETLHKLGIKSEIRQGYSHFWNVVYLNGKQTTFDVTTDIVLKNRYLTLGNSTIQHQTNTSRINFYSADYPTQVYDTVASHSFAITTNN